jgi:hypothetical protein
LYALAQKVGGRICVPQRTTAAQNRSQRDRFPEEQIDNIVLSFMLNEDGWPWSEDEVARELGDDADATDAIRRLTAHGLLHRFGEFVFPTRTARRAAELAIGTV